MRNLLDVHFEHPAMLTSTTRAGLAKLLEYAGRDSISNSVQPLSIFALSNDYPMLLEGAS
jgi:hypothetical protein